MNPHNGPKGRNGHTLFEGHKRFFARYEIRDEEGYPYTDKLKFYVMDLTAIEQATETEQKQGLVEWAKAFKADNWEEVKGIDNTAVKEGEALTTRSAGNLVRAEVIRNKRASLREVA